MTTEEKLNRFLETSINDAMQQSSDIITKYSNALDAELEEYKNSINLQIEQQLKSETNKIRVLTNKELAQKQIEIKRNITKKQEEFKYKIFVEVENKLASFMATRDYYNLLVKQIEEAVKFSDNDQIRIYIDPADESLLNSLRTSTGIPSIVSEYSFLGGTKAVLRSKNILIDNSFQKKLSEIKDAFIFYGSSFHGGGFHG